MCKIKTTKGGRREKAEEGMVPVHLHVITSKINLSQRTQNYGKDW